MLIDIHRRKETIIKTELFPPKSVPLVLSIGIIGSSQKHDPFLFSLNLTRPEAKI